MNQIQKADFRVLELERIVKANDHEIHDKSFEIDELKVEVIRFQRINDSLAKENKYWWFTSNLLQKNRGLVETSDILVQENAQLHKRIRDLIDANKEVTVNYQIVKKNFDTKKLEAEELSLELDDAKNACQLALVPFI